MRFSTKLLRLRPQWRRGFSALTSLRSSDRSSHQMSAAWQIVNFPHPDLSECMRLQMYFDDATTNYLNMIRHACRSHLPSAGRPRIRTELEFFSRMPSQYLPLYQKALTHLTSRTSSVMVGPVIPYIYRRRNGTYFVQLKPGPHGRKDQAHSYASMACPRMESNSYGRNINTWT
jgi:hypothetical protein